MTWMMSPADRERYERLHKEREGAPTVVPDPVVLGPAALAEALGAPGPLLLIDSPAMREALEEAGDAGGTMRIGTSSTVSLGVLVKAAREGRAKVLVDCTGTERDWARTILEGGGLGQARIAFLVPEGTPIPERLAEGLRAARCAPAPVPGPGNR